MTLRQAQQAITAITNLRGAASDEQALGAMALYPAYAHLTLRGETVQRGFRFRYDGRLWRTEQPSHTFDGVYAPGEGTESLFSEVVLPGDGTQERPINYSGNMELEEGKYYTQDDVLYICTAGTGIPVYHDLSALVGLYVRIVE